MGLFTRFSVQAQDEENGTALDTTGYPDQIHTRRCRQTAHLCVKSASASHDQVELHNHCFGSIPYLNLVLDYDLFNPILTSTPSVSKYHDRVFRNGGSRRYVYCGIHLTSDAISHQFRSENTKFLPAKYNGRNMAVISSHCRHIPAPKCEYMIGKSKQATQGTGLTRRAALRSKFLEFVLIVSCQNKLAILQGSMPLLSFAFASRFGGAHVSHRV